MGEVWRATDSRLRREVALKMLPAAFTADRERLARFEREAQLLAQLQHSNIAAIYGIEEANGTRALVMELVEGEELSALLARGALPVAEALAIARQIAEALEAAHEHGIVHRDLKPQNVKVRADGTVKVLDFGLAKALEPASGGAPAADPANSPTLTGAAGTQLGMVLGTAAYMAPEQAAGRAVDRRADIWAWGVVLYEMLTGRALFAGDSVAETLAGVLKGEIDLAALPAATPPAVRQLLRRCLERQPRSRLHDAGDARIVLDDVLGGRADEGAAVAAAPPADGWRRSRLLPWAVATLGVALGVAGLLAARRPAPPAGAGQPVTRFAVMPPGPGELDGYPALSPDGRSLAFCFAPEGEVPRLWLHSFDSGESRLLAGTEGAEQPFWSPDGRHLGYFAGAQVRRLEIATGYSDGLATASDPRGATWSEAGEIVFSPTCCTALSRVAAAGGEARPLTVLDAAMGEGSHRFPVALPGGEAILFTITDGKRPGIYWLAIASGERRFLLPETARAAYDRRGYLLWRRGGSLVARRFDPRTATLTGEAFVIRQEVGTGPDKTAEDLFAVAAGEVALRAGAPDQRELVWIGRDGTAGEVVATSGNYYDPALSPDGARVAVAKSPTPNYFKADVWIYDVHGRDRASRFTFTGGHTPIWSADGTTIYYHVQQGGEWRIAARRADSQGAEEVLLRRRQGQWPDDVSRREPLLVVEGSTAAGTYKLWLLSLHGERTPRPFEHALRGSQAHAAFSPDGRLLAYSSDESGQPEVYVQAIDGSRGRWQVSSTGGDLVKWRDDGRELYYVGFDRRLRAVQVRSLSPFTVGDTAELFPLRISRLAITSQYSYYEPSADGRRFLVNRSVVAARDPGILVTMGWSPP
jgi:Tol biopolymer transport system component